jgi:hypothetical protein
MHPSPDDTPSTPPHASSSPPQTSTALSSPPPRRACCGCASGCFPTSPTPRSRCCGGSSLYRASRPRCARTQRRRGRQRRGRREAPPYALASAASLWPAARALSPPPAPFTHRRPVPFTHPPGGVGQRRGHRRRNAGAGAGAAEGSAARPPGQPRGAPPPPPPAPPAGPLGVTGCPSFQLPACGRLLWPTPPISGPLNPHPQKAASPYIKAQWAWASVCNLTKMTSVKREAFPISFEVRPPTPPGVVASTRAAACAADGVRCARAGGAPPLPGASRRPRPARRFDPWTRTRRWSVSCARRWPLAARPPPLAAAQPPTPPPHPPPLQALAWIVREALTPLNFVLAVEAAVWFVERAAAEHPDLKVGRGPPRQGWA